MTTMTTELGLLPLALGITQGSELQSPMAITVMGGLMISTILTLFVIPCSYSIVADFITSRTALKPALKGHPEESILTKKAIILPPPKAEPRLAMTKIKPLIVKIEEKKPVEPEVAPSVSKPPLQALNRRQKQLVEYLRKAKKVTRKEYAELFKISVPTAARDLKDMVDKHMLVAYGPQIGRAHV